MAEEPLPAGGSCLLGSLNLSEFVKNPFTSRACIDFDALEQSTATAVVALNRVLLEGLERHPLKEQRDSVYDWRQIGLGTLGLADMLIKLGRTYGSSESLAIIKEVYKTIATTAIETSLQLAKTEECFPKCSDKYKEAIANSSFVQNLKLPKNVIADIRKFGLFNSQLLTCAPTGSIGTMLQVSTGVEPNFAFSYNRRTVSLNKTETTYAVEARIVNKFKKVTNWAEAELPEFFVKAEQINPIDRIRVQATLQSYIDASISSTINLPNSVSVSYIAKIYEEAWRQGLKGITIWRDGCQRQAILSTDAPKKEEQSKDEDTHVKKVTDDCIGRKRTLITGCGTLHLTAFFDRTNGRLLETYFSKGSQGGCALFMVGLSRMVSLAARANVSINAIVDQLKSSGTCPSYAVRKATKNDTSKGSCCPVAIGFALRDMYNEVQGELKATKESSKTSNGPRCPKCGEPIVMTEGCMTCPSCGYSKCN